MPPVGRTRRPSMTYGRSVLSFSISLLDAIRGNRLRPWIQRFRRTYKTPRTSSPAFFRFLPRSTRSFYGHSTSTGATASASLNCGARLRGLQHSMRMTSCSKVAWRGVHGRLVSTSLADLRPKTIASTCRHMSSSKRNPGPPGAGTPAPIWSSLRHPGGRAVHGYLTQRQGRLGARTRVFAPIRRRKVRQVS